MATVGLGIQCKAMHESSAGTCTWCNKKRGHFGDHNLHCDKEWPTSYRGVIKDPKYPELDGISDKVLMEAMGGWWDIGE